MTKEQKMRGIEDAILAGQEALVALEEAEHHLGKAKTLGIMHLLGGDAIMSWLKHGQMDKAHYYIDKAQQELAFFQRELADVNMYTSLMNDDVAKFVDIFFDNLFVDLYMQSKITDVKKKLGVTKQQVNGILERLVVMQQNPALNGVLD